jgi:hypothetical protein
MENIVILMQLIVAFSILIVWVFRFDNIVNEFKQYGLSVLTRTMVGTTKIVLATLLVVGIWVPWLVVIPSLLMGLLMLCAQYFHFKIHNPWQKRVPSIALLLLCILIAAINLNVIP